MKLPTNAQTAETNKVAGMNTEVAIMTGRTNIRKRSICEYATAALTNVRIVNIGTVCNRVVYGNVTRGDGGLFVRKRRRMEKNTHKETPVHQMAVHIESWYFRRRLGVCLGSGRENTSSGLVRPSRGRRDSVRESDTGSLLVVGGGGGSDRGCCIRIVSGLKKFGGDAESFESDGDGEGDRVRIRDCCIIGEAKWANQPLGDSGLSDSLSDATRGMDCA
jgi:hypothetical protein